MASCELKTYHLKFDNEKQSFELRAKLKPL